MNIGTEILLMCLMIAGAICLIVIAVAVMLWLFVIVINIFTGKQNKYDI